MLTFFKNKMVFLTFVSVYVYYECNGIMNTAEYGRFLKSAERRWLWDLNAFQLIFLFLHTKII